MRKSISSSGIMGALSQFDSSWESLSSGEIWASTAHWRICSKVTGPKTPPSSYFIKYHFLDSSIMLLVLLLFFGGWGWGGSWNNQSLADLQHPVVFNLIHFFQIAHCY